MSAVVHPISAGPDTRIARLIALLVERQRLAALDQLRIRLPLTDPDRHDLDVDADRRFADMATAHPETCTPSDTGLSDRQALLLAEIHAQPGRHWHTRKVRRFHRANKQLADRRTAMNDLRLLHQLGHLTAHGTDDQRFYTLNTRKAATDA